jgi:hypothetical protein
LTADRDNDTDDLSELVDPINQSLLQIGSNRIAHEGDTEDIADEVNPSNYDSHHSKAWNDAVE